MTDITDDIVGEISFQSFEDDCRLLGSLLKDVIQREAGCKFMEKLERNRVLAQSACNMRLAGIEDTAELLEKQLASEMSKMTLEEALTIVRAFSHYLTLMGIAETHHRVRKLRSVAHLSKSCDDIFNQLIHGGVSPDELYNNVCKQEVEIVLTAHPTQINRRTLQYKHIRVACFDFDYEPARSLQHLLEFNDRPDLGHEDREMLIEDLVREITSIWQTDELRRHKPTPVDEAKAGLHIVEQSLWKAVPHYLRRVSNALKKHTGRPLPLTCTPIKFGAWMGGDRDGNPNVTSKIMLYFLEEYLENYGQFTHMCVDLFLTWQIGLWEESWWSVSVKFVPVDKVYVRHGIEVADRFFPDDVWTDYKDTLLGNVGERRRDLLLGGFGKSGLVIHERRGRLSLPEIDVRIGGDGSSDVDPSLSISEIGVRKEEVDQRGSVVKDPVEFSDVLLNVIMRVTKDVSLLSRWMAIDLYIREIDNLRFELSMNCCNDRLLRLATEILERETSAEDRHENWNQPQNWSQLKPPSQQMPALPTQLPAGAGLPSCTGETYILASALHLWVVYFFTDFLYLQCKICHHHSCSYTGEWVMVVVGSGKVPLGVGGGKLSAAAGVGACQDGESQYPRVELPGRNHSPLNRQVKQVPGQDVKGCPKRESSFQDSNQSLHKKFADGNMANSSSPPSAVIPRASSFSSNQLLAQRKLFAESQIGRTSFQKLLEPSLAQRPTIAPYRIVLGHIKDTLEKTRKRLELLLEDLPCEYDPWDYYETPDQLMEPLLLCHESLQSCGAGVLADGRLADLIRRVATFGMNLMKLDLRQESGRHSDTLDAITRYLDMGTYSEWDEEKRLEFLTRELKGKRPLIPPTIERAATSPWPPAGPQPSPLKFFTHTLLDHKPLSPSATFPTATPAPPTSNPAPPTPPAPSPTPAVPPALVPAPAPSKTPTSPALSPLLSPPNCPQL
ncbi:hypothetical protein HYC85_005213 [Camellia sinensis]|uniref:Phosphoenolpyruvate carboxylase n=1 Tax=Camellia sinensis TaxID=4442 RepID=A0A7J7I1K6_CAMSI|nr:hypothetical protein HYC85_005213 [Camellia sinensis]